MIRSPIWHAPRPWDGALGSLYKMPILDWRTMLIRILGWRWARRFGWFGDWDFSDLAAQ